MKLEILVSVCMPGRIFKSVMRPIRLRSRADYFMIGQEGDLAYFIKKNSDDCIYENDLGVLGSLEMQKVAAKRL